MKKAVGYIRSGISLKEYAKQEKAISEYCKKDGYEVIEWLRDELEGFGAIAYGNWTGHRKIDAVVAVTPGEITENVFEFYAYRCRLKMRGIDLIVTDWKDYDAGYRLHRKVFEEFTNVLCRMEMEHEPVKGTQGRARKARKGGYIGGNAPMGYRVQDGKLVVNPEEVPVVLFIMEEKHAGRTKIGTVEKLNANGYKTRRGGPFQISTVQSIWNNERFYQGYYRYNGEWVKGQHEAII